MEIEEIKKIHPQEGDYVVFKYDIDKIDLDITYEMFKNLESIFPNNQVIAIPVGTELEADDKKRIYEQLCEMFKACI